MASCAKNDSIPPSRNDVGVVFITSRKKTDSTSPSGDDAIGLVAGLTIASCAKNGSTTPSRNDIRVVFITSPQKNDSISPSGDKVIRLVAGSVWGGVKTSSTNRKRSRITNTDPNSNQNTTRSVTPLLFFFLSNGVSLDPTAARTASLFSGRSCWIRVG